MRKSEVLPFNDDIYNKNNEKAERFLDKLMKIVICLN